MIEDAEGAGEAAGGRVGAGGGDSGDSRMTASGRGEEAAVGVVEGEGRTRSGAGGVVVVG